ncbi:hypothetical protein AAFC00_005238 [Neodothiora populina]|uniref:Uncharacterized protein n=1 Tax=Neodothiora populina TaxID=2781224 RepID=A0ABR3PKL1_9PEZI
MVNDPTPKSSSEDTTKALMATAIMLPVTDWDPRKSMDEFGVMGEKDKIAAIMKNMDRHHRTVRNNILAVKRSSQDTKFPDEHDRLEDERSRLTLYLSSEAGTAQRSALAKSQKARPEHAYAALQTKVPPNQAGGLSIRPSNTNYQQKLIAALDKAPLPQTIDFDAISAPAASVSFGPEVPASGVVSDATDEAIANQAIALALSQYQSLKVYERHMAQSREHYAQLQQKYNSGASNSKFTPGSAFAAGLSSTITASSISADARLARRPSLNPRASSGFHFLPPIQTSASSTSDNALPSKVARTPTVTSPSFKTSNKTNQDPRLALQRRNSAISPSTQTVNDPSYSPMQGIERTVSSMGIGSGAPYPASSTSASVVPAPAAVPALMTGASSSFPAAARDGSFSGSRSGSLSAAATPVAPVAPMWCSGGAGETDDLSSRRSSSAAAAGGAGSMVDVSRDPRRRRG